MYKCRNSQRSITPWRRVLGGTKLRDAGEQCALRPDLLRWLTLKVWEYNIPAGHIGRALYGVGLRPLACWNCGFESRRGHGCVPWVECCVFSGRVFCDQLITCREESYRLWCIVYVICETQEWGGHGPRWAAAPWGRKHRLFGSESLLRS